MNIPETLLYTKNHEWVRPIEGGFEIGITDYAQDALGDIVFVNLPEVGSTVAQDESICDVESVKAVSGIYAPLDGKVTAINEALLDAPEALNQDPYSAWLARFEGTVDAALLLTPTEYQAIL